MMRMVRRTGIVRGGVATTELAARLGMDRSALLKWLKVTAPRLGITPKPGRSPASRNQLTWMVTHQEAARLVAERVRLGFAVPAAEVRRQVA